VEAGWSARWIGDVPDTYVEAKYARAERRLTLRQVWRGLDQRELLRPSTLVRALCGLWLMAVLLTAATAAAQGRGGASVRITVLDETAAVLPGAIVLLVGDDGVEHTLQVDDTGVAVATDLTPGTYTVGASFPGFRPASGGWKPASWGLPATGPTGRGRS